MTNFYLTTYSDKPKHLVGGGNWGGDRGPASGEGKLPQTKMEVEPLLEHKSSLFVIEYVYATITVI